MMDSAKYIGVVSAVLFAVLFGLERIVPLRQSTRSLWRRVAVNFVVSALALGVGAIAIRPMVAQLFDTESTQVGLLYWLQLPVAVEVVMGFLLMDLTFYYWHLANHRLPFLWRFHNVHHIDPDLDVSTAFRFHFGEMIFSVAFRAVQVVLIGIRPLTFIIYELAFQANTLFHHSNVRLPVQFERILNCLLVTPRMHGIHHSQVRDETNSNYSVVLPWWDWLHRTIRLNVPQSEIRIGVPAYTLAHDNDLRSVLMMPFRKQRDYWKPIAHELDATSGHDDFDDAKVHRQAR